MLIISWTLHCLLILLSVAFFTLFERKVISLFHLRVGPNKVRFLGLIQPLLDAFKLLSKQDLYPRQSNKFCYSLSPILSLFMALFVWLTMPMLFLALRLNYSFVIFFFATSAMVFPVLLGGWSSNSKYSLVGRLRSIAQSISYEAVFSTAVVVVLTLHLSYRIQRCGVRGFAIFLPILPLWVVCVLAESHRAPFDFSEAESELVSGFNTEYSGAFFAFIFLSEYSVLLFSSMLIYFIFFKRLLPELGGIAPVVVAVLATLAISFLFVWIRITYCRFRYDLLMVTAWKLLLPLSLIYLLLAIFLLLV